MNVRVNLILVEESDFCGPELVRVRDRRFTHVRDIHRAGEGDSLRVGLVGGKIGSGLITSLSDSEFEMQVTLDQEPPEPLPLKLFMALPRPKFLSRVLQTATSLGVKEVYLFNSYKVEKVYWSCQQLTPESVRESCLLGLEQARDTILPRVHLKKLFKPFVEDEVPSLIATSTALVAHPGSKRECPRGVQGHVSLVIGPEGGFIDYEVQKLEAAGFEPVALSARILKVETAVATLIGRIL
jgi:16S rRNA (uracil1498-N3)-methyltransferase